MGLLGLEGVCVECHVTGQAGRQVGYLALAGFTSPFQLAGLIFVLFNTIASNQRPEQRNPHLAK